MERPCCFVAALLLCISDCRRSSSTLPTGMGRWMHSRHGSKALSAVVVWTPPRRRRSPFWQRSTACLRQRRREPALEAASDPAATWARARAVARAAAGVAAAWPPPAPSGMSPGSPFWAGLPAGVGSSTAARAAAGCSMPPWDRTSPSGPRPTSSPPPPLPQPPRLTPPRRTSRRPPGRCRARRLASRHPRTTSTSPRR